MALLDCKECGKQVSSSANCCPHCGCPLKDSNKLKCPACGSLDIEKISLKNKIGSAALIGIFSIGHISKTFKCESCGFKW